jgi:hypothetical protein
MGEPADLGDLDGLRELADAVASGWAAVAAGVTTSGRERAILRLFGVSDLDRDGRPLAARVVERYLAGDHGRLAGGIAVPFAMAMVEYDMPAQETALDVASGAIDLSLEASLLDDPVRRAAALHQAGSLAAAACERVDANRTARHELLDLLGDAPRPWAGAALVEPAIADALGEAVRAVAAGTDAILVAVPPGHELAGRAAAAGLAVEPWRPGPASRGGLSGHDPEELPVPAGSQRALAVLRAALDEAAAERGAYVRLATVPPSLGAPEQAVVTAFERVDLVVADPLAEIVDGRVHPRRALADHAFTCRLLARADATLLIGAGPLVVAPDLASGIPSDSAIRAGRALALQLAACAFARSAGMPAGAVFAGAIPDWTLDEPGGIARAAAEVALRRLLLPGHPLAFMEPVLAGPAAAAWWAAAGALLPAWAPAGLLAARGHSAHSPTALRATARVAGHLAHAIEAPALVGAALEHARDVVHSARATLEAMLTHGWSAVLGEDGWGAALGADADAIAQSGEPFDPLAPAVVPGVAMPAAG